MDQLVALRSFCRVAACGSFSQAARELGVAQSAVSRAVAALEERVGVRLFERTTRRVALTIEGRAYLAAVQDHVRAIEDADLRAAAGFDDLAGRVKVAAPGALGRVLLMPELLRLMAESRGLAVEVALADTRVDLARGAFDFAIRVGAGSEPTFAERSLGVSAQWLVAAPSLFGERAPSMTPNDLRGVPAVVSGRGVELARLGLDVRLSADDLDAALTACLSGLGVSVLPRWLTASHVSAGRLVRLPLRGALPSPPVVAVFPRRLRRIARHVLDRLAQALAPSLDARA